jgi:Lon protease-like protein
MENENKPSNPLAEKARNYTVSPKEQVWNKLDMRLSATPKRKRRSLQISRVTIIAAIIIALLTIIAVTQITHILDKKPKTEPRESKIQ